MYADDDDQSEEGEYRGNTAPTYSGNTHLPSDVPSLQREITRLREILSVAQSGSNETRYFELVKKNRDLNVKLEAEKARCNKLMSQITSAEKERQENEKLQNRGVLLPSQKAGAKTNDSNAPLDATAAEVDILSKELEETRQKLDRAQKSNAALRKSNDEYKRDAIRFKKLLALEVGEDNVERCLASAGGPPPTSTTPADELQSPRSVSGVSNVTLQTNKRPPASAIGASAQPTPAWRGRAQQIALLKTKVKELTRDLLASRGEGANGSTSPPRDYAGADFDTVTVHTTNTAFGRRTAGANTIATCTSVVTGATHDVDDLARGNIEKAGQRRLQDLRELERQLQLAMQDAESHKTRAESFVARQTVLERDNQHLKLCMGRLVEKTQNDDKLIETYKAELETQRSQFKRSIQELDLKLRQGSSGGASTTADLQAEVHSLQFQNAELKKEVAKLQRRTQFGDSDHSPIDAIFAAKQVDVSDDTALGVAKQVIEQQRETVLAFEDHVSKAEEEISELRQRLQDMEKEKYSAAAKKSGINGPLSPSKGLSDIEKRQLQFIREENQSLKNRLKSLSNTFDREMAFHQATSQYFEKSFKALKAEMQNHHPAQSIASTSATNSARGTHTHNDENEEEEEEAVETQQKRPAAVIGGGLQMPMMAHPTFTIPTQQQQASSGPRSVATSKSGAAGKKTNKPNSSAETRRPDSSGSSISAGIVPPRRDVVSADSSAHSPSAELQPPPQIKQLKAKSNALKKISSDHDAQHHHHAPGNFVAPFAMPTLPGTLPPPETTSKLPMVPGANVNGGSLSSRTPPSTPPSSGMDQEAQKKLAELQKEHDALKREYNSMMYRQMKMQDKQQSS